ncbi:MAG TPA: ATP synthase subunit I [Desulfosporosinus sp.]|nr:ATP synthase subunit I [Desulfosporosinus sp.]
MIKSNLIALGIGTACIIIGIIVTGHQTLLGCLIGYWIGFANDAWLHYEVKRSSELDLRSAVKRIRRSYITRMSMVAIVFAVVARLQASWLIYLAVGIAAGVIFSFVLMAIHQISAEGGDKKNA